MGPPAHYFHPFTTANFGLVIHSGQEVILIPEEGTFGKGCLSGIWLLYMCPQGLCTRIMKRKRILLDQIM